MTDDIEPAAEAAYWEVHTPEATAWADVPDEVREFYRERARQRKLAADRPNI